MIRRVDHGWRLRELMAARGMTTISDLIPHLADRGITLSDSQLYRLLSGTPSGSTSSCSARSSIRSTAPSRISSR
ncbi:hypothetical protein QE374_000293 [Microbacterium sp. SORGH_AS428]|nr:hypothetical protein [Microbacterium sp. SORGH_AS_0428]